MSPISLALAVLFSIPGWGATAPASSSKEQKPHKAAAEAAAAYPLPQVPASTEPLTVPSVIARFEKLDADLETLEARFTQYVKWDDSGMTQTVEGSIEFKKPELLRLRHRVPEAQVLVSDGELVWIHRESTNQVVKARLSDWKRNEPLAQGLLDFGRYAGLLKRYDVELSSQGAPGKDGHRDVELRLRPRERKAAQDFTLTLRFSTRDYFPTEASLKAGAVSVRSTFSGIRYNPPLPPERFRFSPPAGADVFDNSKSKAR